MSYSTVYNASCPAVMVHADNALEIHHNHPSFKELMTTEVKDPRSLVSLIQDCAKEIIEQKQELELNDYQVQYLRNELFQDTLSLIEIKSRKH